MLSSMRMQRKTNILLNATSCFLYFNTFFVLFFDYQAKHDSMTVPLCTVPL